jgi:hypothetical protein
MSKLLSTINPQQRHLDATRAFKLRADDVLIATFPKNGTTWTQKIIQNLHKIHQTGHDLTKDEKASRFFRDSFGLFWEKL